MTFFLFFALQLFGMSRRESCIKTTLAMYDNDLVRFFNNVRTLNFKAQPTNTVFRYRESNVRRLVLPSDCCRARGIQIVEHSLDNETVLGSSRKLRGAAEHLIDGRKKRICQLNFEFLRPHIIERRSKSI